MPDGTSVNRQFERGVFCFSLDFELAWGVLDYPGFSAYKKRFARSREVVNRLCTLLDRYRMPATWATVGHLMLERCQAHEGRKHPDIPRPPGLLGGNDWFHLDPCSDVEHAPDFYAPDLVRRVLACATRQEIASHSFSHIRFDERVIGADTVCADLSQARVAAQALNIELTSFVFPCNVEGFHAQVREAGFTCYRGTGNQWYDRRGLFLQKIGHWFDQWAGLAPSLQPCSRHSSGLWNIPATMFLMPFDGARSLGGVRARLRKVDAGIGKACATGGLFHVWTHPHNFYEDPERMLGLLDRILARAADLREHGKLDVLTMRDIATKLNQIEAQTERK